MDDLDFDECTEILWVYFPAVVRISPALSNAFMRKDCPARPSDRFASTWKNADRLECVTAANAST